MDSSIKVFNKAWSWVKLIFGIAVTLLIITGGTVLWKVSDFWMAVGTAEQSVTDTAKKSGDDITRVSTKSSGDISSALDAGKVAIKAASDDAVRQSQDLKKTTIQSRADISKEIGSFQGDLQASRLQLEAANSLQPEMVSVRQQLAQAVKDIQSQQKIISSSETFVKNVFSSHATEYFIVGQTPASRYVIVPPATAGGLTTVLMLLQSVPIQNTLQLQFNIFSQPPNSYFAIKNLVVFFWHDPPDNLKTQQLSVAYFPDEGDKELIKALSEHDGRAFADDQPLPKYLQADPDFKGNKWMPMPVVSGSPAKP